jgi:hypothetical protein
MRYRNAFTPRDVGRPLGDGAADETKVAKVLELHEAGEPVWIIMDETKLSRQTVRTIIGRKHGTDRTTKKRRAKWMPPDAIPEDKAGQRTFAALPKRVTAQLAEGAELGKEAKGLGKAR